MAFGIDDALAAAAAGINLTETVVETIKRYKKQTPDDDLELLLEEVRITAIAKINDADLALTQFERMLTDRKIDTNRQLSDVIAMTPFWRPFEQRRLARIRATFNEFSDRIYASCDSVAALARCRDQTLLMGEAIVASSKNKHQLQQRLANAGSFKAAIDILRLKLNEHKTALGG